jgi:hypothetical protein
MANLLKTALFHKEPLAQSFGIDLKRQLLLAAKEIVLSSKDQPVDQATQPAAHALHLTAHWQIPHGLGTFAWASSVGKRQTLHHR